MTEFDKVTDPGYLEGYEHGRKDEHAYRRKLAASDDERSLAIARSASKLAFARASTPAEACEVVVDRLIELEWGPRRITEPAPRSAVLAVALAAPEWSASSREQVEQVVDALLRHYDIRERATGEAS